MRISIIGGPASGKTTLAEKISKKLSIPHIQLDRFWFEAGGLAADKNKTTAEELGRAREYMKQKTFEIIEKDAWVSDGFYSRSVGPEISKRADVIIYIKIPIWRRLLNHFQRILKPSTRHQELTWWDELIFFYEIIHRNYTNGPKLKSFVETYKDKVITLKSRKETTVYLQKLH